MERGKESREILRPECEGRKEETGRREQEREAGPEVGEGRKASPVGRGCGPTGSGEIPVLPSPSCGTLGRSPDLAPASVSSSVKWG